MLSEYYRHQLQGTTLGDSLDRFYNLLQTQAQYNDVTVWNALLTSAVMRIYSEIKKRDPDEYPPDVVAYRGWRIEYSISSFEVAQLGNPVFLEITAKTKRVARIHTRD